MRLLMYAAVLAAGIAVAFWLMQSRQDARRRGAIGGEAAVRGATTGGSLGDDVSPVQRRSHARLLYGPEAGPGWLTLYSTQLVFTTQSGRVVVTERFDIHGVTTSQDLPDRKVARPALVVACGGDTLYFEVDDPGEWAAALL